MITSTGRDLISKYLIGQTTSFASHIAIGCGATPVSVLGDYKGKTELDFEMGRYPIISRSISTELLTQTATSVQATGTSFIFTLSTDAQFSSGQTVIVSNADQFVNTPDPATNSNGAYTIVSTTTNTITVTDPQTGGNTTVPQTLTGQTISIVGYVPQIVFSAELPIQDRYEITEFGIYPSGSNTFSNGTDSYVLSNFTTTEQWQYANYNGGNTVFSDLVYYTTITDATNNITVTDKAFQTNADNPFFNGTRVARQERPRFLKDCTIVVGDMSDFTAALTPSSTSNYISISNFGLDLSQNSSLDEIRLAMSLINDQATPSTTPRSLNIMFQFVTADGNDNAKYHFRTSDATSLISGTGLFATSRYQVLSLQLSQATFTSKTSNFDWKNVRGIRVYASVESAANYSGSGLTDFAICLDAVRFENKSNTNPLYGLTGYTVVNTAGIPIVKSQNTNNLIEFKFVVGATRNV